MQLPTVLHDDDSVLLIVVMLELETVEELDPTTGTLDELDTLELDETTMLEDDGMMGALEDDEPMIAMEDEELLCILEEEATREDEYVEDDEPMIMVTEEELAD